MLSTSCDVSYTADLLPRAARPARPARAGGQLRCARGRPRVTPALRRRRRRSRSPDASTVAPQRSPVSEWPPRVGRAPMAPGLFVYRWPLNAIVSGMHRVSGLALVIGFSSVAMGSALLPAGTTLPDAIVSACSKWPRALRIAAKWCIGTALAMHWVAGTRYLAWEWGLYPFSVRCTTYTSSAIVAAAIGGGTALSLCSFPFPQHQKPSVRPHAVRAQGEMILPKTAWERTDM
uniref:Mitochondrial succinate dehydrogenase C n=1 Tax=Mastigamoeba balamuthi TaxID=108607 RepID=A0A0B5D2L2_MASBA|nr:mitochondrial succinate dehydrogenase C [Mastigamoeba balamuthi]